MTGRSVLVVVTHGGQDPHRARALELVLHHYGLHHPEWSGHLAQSEVTPFPKASLVNHAVREHGAGADVVVLNDADSLVPSSQAAAAVELAREQPGLVFAFTRYLRLNRTDSERVQSVDELPGCVPEWVMDGSGSHGCVAISRACWDELGGLDEGYGWMHEDLDFDNRAAALWPLRRVPGPLWHLWHPRDPLNDERNRARYEAQWGAAV